MMLVSAKSYWVPKLGNTVEEYEDAFWPPSHVAERDPIEFRCAIADGATETSFSGLWARLLARRWCEVATLDHFVAAIPEVASEWLQQVETHDLPWYAEEKVRSGAFSTLTGIRIVGPDPAKDLPIRFEAAAIGDSCLFHIRGPEILASFPLSASEDFNSRPFLIGSALPATPGIQTHLATASGDCLPGDALLLMTDAIACFFLRLQEEDGDAVSYIVDDNMTPERFLDFVQEWRGARDEEGQLFLRNDDVTMIRIDVLE